MCGFVGVTNLNNKINENQFTVMLSKIHSRGPDATKIQNIDGVFLGHKRLSILDLTEDGSQPMTDSSNRYHIIYNGEVYNFQELREGLELKYNISFNSNCDTEVILNLFIREGRDFVHKLNGMFSIFIFDRKDQKIYLFRDRYGIKPLHYSVIKGELIVSSELKAIVKHPFFKKEIEPKAVESFFLYRYIPAPLTIWENVFKLEQGCRAEFDLKTKKIKIDQYYDLKDNLQTRSDSIRDGFQKSVKYRLIADVEVATFLSGGVDSSLVSKIAKDLNPNVRSFSIGFEPKQFSEHHFAEKMAKELKLKNNVDIISSVKEGELEAVFKTYDEPFADSSMFPTYFLCQRTAKHVKVALSGDGGDELFAGYNWYKNSSHLFEGNFFEKLFFPQKYQHHIAKNYCDHLLQRFNLENIHHLLGKLPKSKDYIFERYINGKSNRTLQYIDFHTFLVDDILVKVDRASMASSLEVRVPFLDHNFVELIYSQPESKYPLSSTDKIFMQEVFSRDLPSWVFDRKKQGFSAPIVNWIEDLGLFSESYLDLVWTVGLLDKSFLDSGFYKNHPQKKNVIWMLFCYESWLKEYFVEK